MLAGIDVLVFDIQDVGARPYTYVSTMAYVMQAAAQYGKDVWVLDRPNPTGGVLIDGPVLEPKFRSFVGLYPIPERHGMTVGELARLINDHFGVGCRLRVIPMQGWTRDMLWADTGLTWIPTSPNMPFARTTLVYLATGLVDEGGINNGVGTDRPFEYAGGFGFDAAAFRAQLAARAIPGVEFEPAEWVPVRGFWSGKTLAVWLRELALKAAHERPADPTELVLAELSALRYTLLNLFHASASAQTEGKFLLPESVVKIRDKAEARKLADARKLLSDFLAGDGAGGKK